MKKTPPGAGAGSPGELVDSEEPGTRRFEAGPVSGKATGGWRGDGVANARGRVGDSGGKGRVMRVFKKVLKIGGLVLLVAST